MARNRKAPTKAACGRGLCDMSLQSLIELRKYGQVPNAVWVLIGAKPKWLTDSPSIITVDVMQDHLSLDFRPLIGVHVDVFELCQDEAFCERIERAIDTAKPKSSGLATRHGISGLNDQHIDVLHKAWEMLCS